MSRRPLVVLLHGVQSSASTWWRVAPDLTDLGYEVRALDQLGHGGRAAGEEELSLDRLARDVATQLAGRRADLIVGHSMGALVGLTLAAAHPELVGALVAEDPPALGPELDPADVASGIEAAQPLAQRDPAAAEAAMRADNPLWAARDAATSVASLLALDALRVTAWLRRERWDLPALVRDCPVPLHLLLASGPGSATTEPARTDIRAYLGPEHVTEVASGHSVHRDRPGVWVGTVLHACPA